MDGWVGGSWWWWGYHEISPEGVAQYLATSDNPLFSFKMSVKWTHIIFEVPWDDDFKTVLWANRRRISNCMQIHISHHQLSKARVFTKWPQNWRSTNSQDSLPPPKYLSEFGDSDRKRNRSKAVILLMEEILRSYGKYTIIYRVSYISGGAGFQPSTVGEVIEQIYTLYPLILRHIHAMSAKLQIATMIIDNPYRVKRSIWDIGWTGSTATARDVTWDIYSRGSVRPALQSNRTRFARALGSKTRTQECLKWIMLDKNDLASGWDMLLLVSQILCRFWRSILHGVPVTYISFALKHFKNDMFFVSGSVSHLMPTFLETDCLAHVC